MDKSHLPVLPAALGFLGLALFTLSLYFLGPEYRAVAGRAADYRAGRPAAGDLGHRIADCPA